MHKNPHSYWISTTPANHYPSLNQTLKVDVAIIGGGITGLTTALLLKKAGKKVAVLEKKSIAMGDSGHTTAHLTEVLDTRYHQLISDFGREGAQLAAQSSRAAIE